MNISLTSVVAAKLIPYLLIGAFCLFIIGFYTLQIILLMCIFSFDFEI